MPAANDKPALLPERTPCERCPFHALPTLQRFTPPELAFIKDFKIGEMVFNAGATVLVEGAKSPNLYTILSGWTLSYKLLDDGRRQVLAFSLPSDFLGLQASVFREMTHSVEALSQVTVCVFARADLWRLFNDYPSLAYDMTWLGARAELMLNETLLSVGRRSASERMANLLLQLFIRAEAMRLVQQSSVHFPFTQQHLADALGLSLVHTNKTIQSLVRRRLFTWRGGRFELLDRAGLSRAAHYEFEEPTPRPFI